MEFKLATKQPKLALGDDLQFQAAQFAILPAYADAIRTADPEATAMLARRTVKIYVASIVSLFALA